MRLLAALPAVLLVLAALPHVGASTTSEVLLDVGGVLAHGVQALPAGECRGIVVVAHGYGHNAVEHTGHLTHLADEGFAAIAMDYSGPLDGFPLGAGIRDTIAAADHLRAQCPGGPAYLYSVSMGTAVAGPVLASMPNFFSIWVDSEGLSQLAETWAEATALSPGNAFAKTASDAIVAECHGTPAERPACYHERSAALRASEFVGLQGVVLAHALNDGLVPYNQGREMQAALNAQGIKNDFFTVVRDTNGGTGTTLTGYGSHDLDNGFTGHGTESVDTDTMTALTFGLLDQVVMGTYGQIGGGETVLESDVGMVPLTA
ncbi:MAG: hypothetical protein WDA16_01495 [Candidatus Thermoplasmatota archaeon]